MGFADIIGHQKPLGLLRSALAQGRLHHAYLFTGPEGVGKHLIALALAKAIHCGDSGEDFCGRCAVCARIDNGNQPDVRVVEILAEKKEISIQQVREIEKGLNFRSFSGKRKIAIIDPATAMNLPAQNALLKTLEEPPEDSLLILIAANAGALLPTLRSRCLRLPFGPLPRAEIAAFLAAREGISQGEAQLIAAMSMGSLAAAVALHKEELAEKRRAWREMLLSLRAGDHRAAIAAAEKLAGDREEALEFLRWIEVWYRDLLVYAAAENAADLINLDLLPEIERLCASNRLEHILFAYAESAGAAARIQRNLNRRMVLEKLFFNLSGAR